MTPCPADCSQAAPTEQGAESSPSVCFTSLHQQPFHCSAENFSVPLGSAQTRSRRGRLWNKGASPYQAIRHCSTRFDIFRQMSGSGTAIKGAGLPVEICDSKYNRLPLDERTRNTLSKQRKGTPLSSRAPRRRVERFGRVQVPFSKGSLLGSSRSCGATPQPPRRASFHFVKNGITCYTILKWYLQPI